MSEEDSLEDRQRYELEALEAIYGDQLKDLRRKAAWNKWTPLNLSIMLTPQRGSSDHQEVHVTVDLHVICALLYPKKAPQILLESPKGISKTHLSQLKMELDKEARALEGEEMIFQLCQYVEEFLHQHNKPAIKSFDDERLRQQQKEKQELERQRENMMKEVEEREEMLKAEVRLGRDKKKSWSETDVEDEGHRRSSLTYKRQKSSDEEHHCNHKNILSLDFSGRIVHRGQCLYHTETSVSFSAIDWQTGELLEIVQWQVAIKNNNHDSNQIVRNLTSIDQELAYLSKLKHANLVHYLAFKKDLQEEDEDKALVYILKEFVNGPNCHSLFTSQNTKIGMDHLKHVAKSVLSALDYIHRNNVVHKDLNDACVHINDKGNVKVSNYSIHRRLLDLVSSTHGYYSKKTDILDFGRLILGLLGEEKEDRIPTHLPSDIYDLLLRCFDKDEKQRFTANQLLNHSFFHKPIVHFSPENVAPTIERNVSPEIVNSFLLSTSLGNGQSRIDNEFERLENLGKGAFGDVLKVRNKLDNRYYAIKRIKLNPKNKALRRKILREVTLLSRLNHENVVRYYSAWIESTTRKGDLDDESSVTTTTAQTTEPEKVMKVVRKDGFSDIEKHAPHIETSITFDSNVQAAYDEFSDDSSDEDDPFAEPVANRFAEDSDSEDDGIQFEHASDEDSTPTEAASSKGDASLLHESALQDKVTQEDCLYIQMEFCEKSTLRTAIDGNLYLDEDRVWVLFREIVEGLTHIHQQGMIHRDLKPVNIFLDSFGHVKIGDFGLATTIAKRSKYGEGNGIFKSQSESLKEDVTDESKTGQVGTALYVAPEISCASNPIYNQKVDIYSLGIILFEMCYQPVATGMERIKILGKLRSKDIIFPADFNERNERAKHLISWLLQHDISKRPSSQELLQSEHLPPPVLEERQLQELVRHTLTNPQSKGYRYLISSCFKQTITPAQDVTYDRDPTNPMSSKPMNMYDFVKEVCVKIFKQHGGQNLATPMLMPKSKFYEDAELCVKLMTHFGNVVTLPHDLRVPFARYVAWNNIGSFRRYSVERVYKEKRVFGFIPREFWVGVFDIVTPSHGNLMSDAEILYIMYEIIKELPGVGNKHFLIKLNHTGLFKAILLHCGLKDKHEELIQLLTDIKDGKVPRSQLQNFLINRGLPDNMINLLINFLHSEFEVGKVLNHFQMITKKKSGDASGLAKVALQELKEIVENAELYGVEFDFTIAPGLIYNIRQYSGMIFQFVCELRKRKHDNKEVVAAGGRYDSMISFYKNIMEQTNMSTKDSQQSAVGISISLDKLVQALQRQDADVLPKVDSLDAIVCSIGSKQLRKEKAQILRRLWAAGVRCQLIEPSNTVDVQEHLMELGVSYAIILNDNDQGMVRLKSWNKNSRESFDRFQEKYYTINELVENMQRILKLRNDSSTDSCQTSNTLTRSESKGSYSERMGESEPVVEILLVTMEKISSSVRKRYENQVRYQLDKLFKKLTGFITVIAVTLERDVVRTLTPFLIFDEGENKFWTSVENCIGRNQRHKNYLNKICSEIWDVRMKKTNPTVVLFSVTDNFYQVII